MFESGLDPSVRAASTADEPMPLPFHRLLWAAPLTIAFSVVAVLLIREVAVAILKPDPTFDPLGLGAPAVGATAGSALAVFAFRSAGRYSLDPVRDYRSLAWKALLLSFVPDIALATGHWFGGGWPEALTLSAMHVAVWAICVSILPDLVTATKHR
jgi:hypothetical protein